MEVDFNALLKAFILHKSAAEYLKNTYTRRDGFISHYPNNISDWIKDAFEDQEHTTASILQFLMYVDYSDYNNLLGDMYDHIEIYEGEYFNYEGMLSAVADHYFFNQRQLTNFI